MRENVAADRLGQRARNGKRLAPIVVAVVVSALVAGTVTPAVMMVSIARRDPAAACQPEAAPHRLPADLLFDANGNHLRGGLQ